MTYGSWFWGDDFGFVSRMLNDGPSRRRDPRVCRPPDALPMYLSWLFNAIAPYDWWPSATLLLLMQAAAGSDCCDC